MTGAGAPERRRPQVTKPTDKKSPKLSIKKDVLKDLKVTADKDVMGGGGKLSQPRTPCDPGCTPCG